MRLRSDGAGVDAALSAFLNYCRIVGLILALVAAVAGGNLAVTTAPVKPRVDQRVAVRSTGQVGDSGGHLYIYVDRSGCLADARSERHRGTRIASLPIRASFDFTAHFTPRRSGRIWVCGYLYAITCDAAGQNCGPATGLPPDAGFSRVLVRVRERQARSAARR
jgi:hypothetical protein